MDSRDRNAIITQPSFVLPPARATRASTQHLLNLRRALAWFLRQDPSRNHDNARSQVEAVVRMLYLALFEYKYYIIIYIYIAFIHILIR